MTPQPSMLILLIVTSAMTLMPAWAQDSPAQTASPAISDKVSSFERVARVNDPGYRSTATAGDAKPFDPAAATQAWLDSVPRNQREKSDAYFEGSYWLILWNFLLTAAISVFLLASLFSARLRDFSERVTKIQNFQVACYAIFYLLFVYALSFPLNLYENFFREHQYGLATQSFAQWFREQLLGLALTLVGGTLLVVVLYAVFRRAPRTWWIWGTIVMIIFWGTVVLIAPVYIEPLFNTYKPLTDPKIRGPILAMARANEIPVKQVFEVDASRQTTRISANVAGLLGTTRVALNDNLLKQCTLPEIRAVMAHEMGHYVLNHGGKLLTYFGILILVGLVFTRILFDAAVKRWGEKWRVRGIADPAGLPLLALIFSTLLFFATPVINTVVRITEREADAFGINTSREPDGMAKAALKLGVYRKLDPTPLEEFIFFDHPSGRARIRMAMDWKAADLPAGESHAPDSQRAIH
ncbi:MAG TPA: M48 family metallopeptidase [Candidatus Dormibacteraeota bacterium]|nr:M48 family metallopeptidase [Candidatus Dormibacteraeota bacterium]